MTEKLIIPPRPELLMEIQQLLSDANPETSELIRLIRRDVGLYTVLLSTVNSPLFRRQFLIESVEHAVATLGIERVSSLVQAVAMRTSIDPDGRLLRFWEAATEVATVCHQLAHSTRSMPADSAYTLGMMHDIGVAVMLDSFENYDVVIGDANSCNAAFIRRVERNSFATDRFEIAGRLAKEWYMPGDVSEALLLQAHAQAALMGNATVSKEVLTANSLLILAKDISAEYQSYWSFESRDALAKLVDKATAYLEIDEDEYLDMKDDLVERLVLSEIDN
ncbi:MAG: HDOD domain-containing protein [Saccharospirillaceae bacterium]|nr:HDOD domain-containing protein [Saccharospirillaceae bacterium]